MVTLSINIVNTFCTLQQVADEGSSESSELCCIKLSLQETVNFNLRKPDENLK